MTLIEHLESYLGYIECGWNINADPTGIQIVLYADKPWISDITLTTLGLSNHILCYDNKELRHELLFSTNKCIPKEESIRLLSYINNQLLHNHKAILRGDVIEIGFPIFKSTKVVGLYVSTPSYFDDLLYVYEGSSPPTVILWLIPITIEEIEFIKINGWSKFEDILEMKNPDLLDMMRQSVI